MTRPLRVFLCHASQDKPAVRKLHRFLKQHEVQPWLDQEDLLPGEDWEVEIPKAIFSSDVILVCLSKNSVDKEGYVQKEITFALDKAQEKPEGTIFVIPVKLEDCDVPKRLSRYQWVDLFRPDGSKRLLMGMNKRAMGLGSGVTPVLILEETRPKPVPEIASARPENPELQKAEQEAREKAEREARSPLPQGDGRDEGKPLPKKPFTKFLEPSSLSSQPISRLKDHEPRARKSAQRKDLRLFGIGGIILFALICGGFGLNKLINNLPAAIAPTPSPTRTAASKPPTSTSLPITPAPQPTETVVPAPTLSIGSTMTGKDGMALLYVAAGKFTMGSDSGSSDEKPVHEVYLDAFWIDETEVTNEMYAKCVDAGKCNAPSSADRFSNSSYANHPVVHVSWNDAVAYCEWVGRRLPTEAEWEKAASWDESNQTKRIYPWGDDIDCSFANYSDTKNSRYCVGDTTQVKSYPSGISPYGAYDMAGNVWEWVADWYDARYYQKSPSSNPLGPDSGQWRVWRGGSWNFNDGNVRSVARVWDDPRASYDSVGFRCARDATP